MNTIKESTKFNNGKDPNIEYPIRLYDEDGNEIYYETSDGFWCKSEYKDGNQVYFEDSEGYWWKREYKDGKEVYYENSDGCIIGRREHVDMTIAEVRKELGKNIRIVG